jgi:hypothetical protein
VTATAWNKGFVALEACWESDMISPCDQTDDSDGYGMNIGSRVFARSPRLRGSSASPELGLSLLSGGKKNGPRMLRSCSFRMVRPQDPAGPGQVLRRRSDLPGPGDPQSSMPELRHRETGKIGLFGRQPVLYQALRVLHRPPLPEFDHQGCGQGIPSRLEYGQSPGDAVRDRILLFRATR